MQDTNDNIYACTSQYMQDTNDNIYVLAYTCNIKMIIFMYKPIHAR